MKEISIRTSGPFLLSALSLAVTIFVGCEERLQLKEEKPVTADYFVALNGNDSWSGKMAEPNRERTDGPFATIAAARDAIRSARKAGAVEKPLTVLIRGGVYRLNEPLVFTSEDSGAKDRPITYAAYRGERVVLSGGLAIGGWVKGKDGNIWTTEVADVKAGKLYFHQLFVDGARRIRARMPNEGYFLNEGPIDPLVDRKKARGDNSTKMGFRFKPGDIKQWTNLEDINVIQFHSWTASVRWIQELDEKNSIVRFTAPANWPTGYWTKNERYYLENFPEALDAPGEWYLDRATGLLSYWPMPGEEMGKALVEAPRLRHIVRFDGDPDQGKFVDHIRLEGLSFQHADWLIKDKGPADGQAATFLEAAILARGARSCAVERCEIAHVGEYALWLAVGCKDNRVAHCHIHDLAGGGVRIGETASPKTDAQAVARNVVDNNFIHDTGHMFHAGIGVWIGRSSFNTVTHNEICDLDYTGVSVGWSWGYAESSANHNVVEFNHIHHIGRGVLGDMGGIYTLGVSPGTQLRNNLIHDVYSPGIGGGTGIYPDEGSTDILIENNLVYNMEQGCFSQHYGKENIVRNNIFAFSQRGEIARYRQEEHISFTFERNIVYSTDGYVLLGNWSNGRYKMDCNLYWDTSTRDIDFGGADFEEWQALGRDTHSIIEDPLFVDPARFDFRLKPGSPALKIGFQPFDTAQAGLYGEPEWVNAPKGIVRKPLALPPPEPRGPKAVDDGFENTPVGQPAAGAVTSGDEKGASIRVTDEIAASGKRCLKFTDAPGLSHDWQPHLFYSPNFSKGIAHCSFDARLEKGAILVHEWRDASQPYLVGPSIQIDKRGQLTANGKPLMAVPIGQWIHVEFAAALGKQATDSYDLTVTVAGQAPKKFEKLPVGKPGWKRLQWLGFISLAQERTVLYIDNVKLDVEKR